jgi:hypothetical protein
MNDTEAWVEVRLWIIERGNASVLRYRGKLQQLDLDQEVVVMHYGYAHQTEYLPKGRVGTIRWESDEWKMSHGVPAGFRKELTDG